MKNSLRLLAAMTLAAMPLLGHAQVTYTNTDASGGSIPLESGHFTAVQTFSGFSNLSSVSWSMTNTGGSATTTFNAYVAQWNTGNNTVTNTVTDPLTGFGAANTSLSLGALATGNLVFTSTGTSLDSSLTYALILTYTGGSSGISANIGTNPADAFFGSGGAGVAVTSFVPGGLNGLQGDLQSSGAFIDTGSAYTMSVTTGISATPAPEPKTAAAGIAVLFVAVLMGRRVWQRNKLTPVPVAA